MSLKSFLQLYNVICNYAIGGVAIRMSRRAFSIQVWLQGGRRSKRVRMQTYFSIPGVYLGEGEDPPPLTQKLQERFNLVSNCVNSKMYLKFIKQIKLFKTNVTFWL